MTKQTYYFKRLHNDGADSTYSIAAREWYSLNGTINGAHHEFLKDVNAWNRDGNGAWVYWEVSREAYEDYRKEIATDG